ncbi:MFS transporter [Deinococcus arenicola]|uniref:MFS transporter n=1 Tax=Deinococcus arenicola TaxID=2994950 RepID=A0ABU4DRC5_9DEIO|nr:MFS transporter [Deinococcus sp. ZS9-10]MDV6374980.1 MFS transporter [Deinococcus sp. ZS9-10]
MTVPATPAELDGGTSSSMRWRYAAMNLGLVIPAQVSSFFFLYYVDHLKVDPVKFAVLMSAFAVYNAVDNPIIGYLSDRTRTRWGRRIPYLLFATLPTMLFLALLFNAPFDGVGSPGALLLYFGVLWVLWETTFTMVGTGYLSLLPEMFRSFAERTDVSVRMNAVQVGGLLIGLALPPLLAAKIGWGPMGILFAVICAAAIYGGVGALSERAASIQATPLPLFNALRSTFSNRSFLTIVAAQTMRFVATGTLATGMGFFVKYSLDAESGLLTTLLLAAAFVTAGVMLWPWRRFVAQKYGARTTLLLAFTVSGLAVLPLAFIASIPAAFVTTALFGVGLAGMILMGDVVLADVIDEDELHTGQRREGSYYGLSGLITTLSTGIVAAIFGWVALRYGYDPKLDVQPDTVAQGFRLFMTVPPLIGSAMAVVFLWFYPLHGARLQEVRQQLAAQREK